VSDLLSCGFRLPVRKPAAVAAYRDLSLCAFPGAAVLRMAADLTDLRASFAAETDLARDLSGWMTQYHVARNITSSWRMAQARRKIAVYVRAIEDIATRAPAVLAQIYDNATVSRQILPQRTVQQSKFGRPCALFGFT
jgi:hypothetical protein